MASVSAGDVVADKYRVERMLGSGGMGFVVAARHLALDQLVAIKFLTKSDAGDDEAYARFRREAKAASGLMGEHVAKVFDVGVHEDAPFIVMEYLDGADLDAVARERGIFSLAETSDYVIQACVALAEAHAHGIVHRDLKLANLFLTRAPSGAPWIKLLDFGVSRMMEREANGDVTRTSMMIGSPKYMSPEQMNDPRRVDARSDVWSLGVCLYRLISGCFPFDGELERVYKLVVREPPPRLAPMRPDVPAAFEAVILRCLEKDRDKRFANVAEVASALSLFASDVDRARDDVAQAAAVLGVPVPPRAGGTAILEAGTQAMFRTSQSIGGAAWAQEMAATRSKKSGSGATLAIAAAAFAIVLAFIGAVVVARSRATVPTAAAAASVTATTPPSATPAIVTPEPPTSIVPATPATIAPSTRVIRPAPRKTAPAKPSAPLPIPGDRK